MTHTTSRHLPAVLLVLSCLLASTLFASTLFASNAAAQSAQTTDADGRAVPVEVLSLEESSIERFPNDGRLSGSARPPVDFAVGDADDPEALLDSTQLDLLRSVGQHLSADRSWMRDEILGTLEHLSLRLDEVFVDGPELVRVGEDTYRVRLEMAGAGWGTFDPVTDRFFVYVDHETYAGLGDDKALAFADGEETVVFAHDLDTTPAISIALADVVGGDESLSEPVAVDRAISLGSAELRMTAERLPVHLFPGLESIAKAGQRFSLEQLASLPAAAYESTSNSVSCTQEVAPMACSAGKPVCTSGYTPYFVMDRIKIKQDHEGTFKGNPEIELFPTRIDVVSPLGSNTTATTDFLFYGRNVTDLAGRTRYLPDVNNVGSWYTITNGVAIFPASLGTEFSAMLVEQDDDRGVLRVKSTKINVTKLFKDVGSLFDYRKIDEKFLFKLGGILLDIIGLFNDGDDIFQESIGVANSLFCANSVGTMQTHTLVSQEWEMQGHFACINPSCPDPGTGGGGGGGGGGDWPPDWDCGGHTQQICP